MQLVSNTLGLLAPHQCLACGIEGYVLCPSCLTTAGQPLPERCAGCRSLSKDYKTCSNCRRWLPIKAVYVATSYEGLEEQLIRAYKFDMKRQAVVPIAAIMTEILPDQAEDTLLCTLPTAPARIRERGYDHAKLLTKQLSRQLEAPITFGLRRHSNRRQLGASRQKRIEQMQGEFYIPSPEEVADKKILLVDDVITTGASLAAAAKTLKQAGAKEIYAIVFAQKA